MLSVAEARTFGGFESLGGDELKSLLTFSVIIGFLAGGIVVARNGQATSESPHVISAVAPTTYPAIAQAANAHGEVIIEAQVDAAGDVLSTKWISGHPLLRKVSERAAKQWKFSPSLESTKERTTRLTFGFQKVDTGPQPEGELTVVFLPPYRVDLRAHSRIIE